MSMAIIQKFDKDQTIFVELPIVHDNIRHIFKKERIKTSRASIVSLTYNTGRTQKQSQFYREHYKDYPSTIYIITSSFVIKMSFEPDISTILVL